MQVLTNIFPTKPDSDLSKSAAASRAEGEGSDFSDVFDTPEGSQEDAKTESIEANTAKAFGASTEVGMTQGDEPEQEIAGSTLSEIVATGSPSRDVEVREEITVESALGKTPIELSENLPDRFQIEQSDIVKPILDEGTPIPSEPDSAQFPRDPATAPLIEGVFAASSKLPSSEILQPNAVEKSEANGANLRDPSEIPTPIVQTVKLEKAVETTAKQVDAIAALANSQAPAISSKAVLAGPVSEQPATNPAIVKPENALDLKALVTPEKVAPDKQESKSKGSRLDESPRHTSLPPLERFTAQSPETKPTLAAATNNAVPASQIDAAQISVVNADADQADVIPFPRIADVPTGAQSRATAFFPITDQVRTDAILARVSNSLEATISKGAAGTYELKLQPVELGTVRIVMSHSETGMTAVVSADRPEVLDLLRRHGDGLLSDLRNSSNGNVEMSFKNSSQQGNQKQDGRDAYAVSLISPNSEPDMSDVTRVADSGLDIRL